MILARASANISAQQAVYTRTVYGHFGREPEADGFSEESSRQPAGAMA
jgi:hypothetical protein